MLKAAVEVFQRLPPSESGEEELLTMKKELLDLFTAFKTVLAAAGYDPQTAESLLRREVWNHPMVEKYLSKVTHLFLRHQDIPELFFAFNK